MNIEAFRCKDTQPFLLVNHSHNQTTNNEVFLQHPVSEAVGQQPTTTVGSIRECLDDTFILSISRQPRVSRKHDIYSVILIIRSWHIRGIY